jgi:hypothetical protein
MARFVRRVSAIAFMIIALLMASSFSGMEQAGAASCSVSISVNPPSGSSFEHGDIVNATFTVVWSSNAPADAAVEIKLYSAFWDEDSSIWVGSSPSLLFSGNNSGSGAAPITQYRQLSPGWRYRFNVSLDCLWFYYDQYGSLKMDSCLAFNPFEVEYAFGGAPRLCASFSIVPESPTINDNITFRSTSTCPVGSIVENKWYLDDQFLQDVGSNESWSGKLASGAHTVTLIVTDSLGDSDTASKPFQVRASTAQGLLLTATAEKGTYITREKIILHGRLTYDGGPVISARINLKIRQADGTVDTWSGPITTADGYYQAEYEVPKIAFKKIPPVPETWTVEVTALPVEPEYGTVSASVTLQVVPVYLQLHSIQLVQVAEAPVIDGRTYLAAGRDSGLRVVVSCPSLVGLSGVSYPEVSVLLDVGSGATNVEQETKKGAIGAGPTSVDFVFSLQSGNYFVGARVDPLYDFMDVSATEQLWMSQSVTVKDMKTMKVEYVPLYIPMDSKDALSDFNKFCEQHSEFVKAVYPLPSSNFKFSEVTETQSPVLLTPTLELQRWLLLKALSIRSYLTADKVVGVLPSGTEWWGPDENGYSSWSLPPFFYYTRSILVRYESNEAVTAHEIGHALGLNRWTWNEEYNTDPPQGRAVSGLILKDGRIFNLANEEEKAQAFGIGTATVYCFMGRDLDFPTPSWVCDKTYPQLFKFLMDPPEEILYVAGSIYSNDTVVLDSWYLGEGEPDPVDEGTYTIQCLSGTGEVLYSTGFGGEVEDFLGFGFVIPYPESTVSVQIKKANQLLKTVQRTPSNPTVAVQFPNGGEKLDGMTTISWSADDQDGDPLLSSVLLSQDGGETWTAFAIELNETSCDVDFSDFPDGNQYLIKVVATDGFNTAQGVSGGLFTVEHASSSGLTTILIIVVVSVIVIVIIAVILAVFVFRKKRKYLDPNLLPPPPDSTALT